MNRLKIVFLFFALLSVGTVVAQDVPKDSTKLVNIIRAESISHKEINDSTQLLFLVGDVQLSQGRTFFRGDSVVQNKQKNTVEVFGNIRINDADSVFISSQYLIYHGNTRIAYLKKGVTLTDKKATLTTEELEYAVGSKTGSYKNNGKIVNGASILTSKEGFYYADTKDAYFTTNVKMVDPERTLATDTLLYNAETEMATFVSPTTIKEGNSLVQTSDGQYDMKTGNANFAKRPVIRDSTQFITGDIMKFDKHTGAGYAEGNFIYRDTSQGVTVMSERSFFNRDQKTFLATLKPVMIIKQDNDSLFLASDTLYSGIKIDTVYNKDTSYKIVERQVMIPKKDSISGSDTSIAKAAPDLAKSKLPKPILPPGIGINKDSTGTDSLPPITKPPIIDSTKFDFVTVKDTVMEIKNRDIRRIDSVRFIQAYRNVRIFADSMQAVCDSLYFTAADSIFRMFTNPILWAKESQITGDTIFLHTKNKKPERVEVWENAFSINKSNDIYYNQLKGNSINGYFNDGDIELIRSKGSAESLYYLQDDDSAYTAANYAQSDLITLYLHKKELQRISWVNEPEGVLYPVKEVPEEKRKFRNFRWEESRRPKSRYALFE